MNNKFIDFIYLYMDLIDSALDGFKKDYDIKAEEYLKYRLSIINHKRAKYDKNILVIQLENSYKSCIEGLNLENKKEIDILKWFDDVKDYIYFLRMSEKLLLFKNSDDNSNGLYCDTDTIYYKDKDYTVKINFEKTSIDLSNNNITYSLLDSLKDDNQKMYIITVSIKRNYGHQMINEFKFVQNEDIKLNRSDKLLIKIMINNLSVAMLNVFDNIVDSTFSTYTGINKKIDWKAVIKNGFRV